MSDPTQAAPPPETNDLAQAFNEARDKEADDAKQSALDVLLSMPRSGEAGGEKAKEGLDFLLSEWDSLLRVGEGIMRTGMARKGLKDPAEVALIMALGRALRIDPIVAINNIYVINAKPTCESKLLAALIFNAHGSDAIHYVELTVDRAVIDFKRRDDAEPTRFEFTIDDATRAGLLKFWHQKEGKWKESEVWKKYPQFMLRHRCMSLGGNAMFPDVSMGMITPEEMGMAVKLDDAGNVVVDQAKLGTPRERKPRKATTPLIDPDADAVLRKDQIYKVVVTAIQPKADWWLADYPGSTYADWAAEYKRCEEAEDQEGMDRVKSATHTAKGHKRPWRKKIKGVLYDPAMSAADFDCNAQEIKFYTESNPETHKIGVDTVVEITIDAVGIDVERPGKARNDDGSRVIVEEHDCTIASGIRPAKPEAPPAAAEEEPAPTPEPPDEEGDVRGKLLVTVQEWRQHLGPAAFARGLKDVGIHDYGQSTVPQLRKLVTLLSELTQPPEPEPAPEEPPAANDDTPPDPDIDPDTAIPCEACGAAAGEDCEPGCKGI